MNFATDPDRAALFPLNSVLFPGCALPLQIFEQRYLRLVKSCLRDNHGFVVTLIREGREVNDRPEIFTTGSYVEIIDWKTLDNGLFGITIRAKHRVRISNTNAQDDGLLTGEQMEIPQNEPDKSLIDTYPDLIDTLKQLEHHPFISAHEMDVDYSDEYDISNKLSQILPVDNITKQSLFEINNTRDRFEQLRQILKQLQGQS